MVKKKESVEILSQTEIAQGVWDLRLKTELAKAAQPGQFVGVYLNNPARLLPRPISICLADAEKEELRLVYRISGEGTAELSTYPAHKSLDLLGVLGNGYPIEGLKGKKILLLGGGIGIPPLLLAAQRLQEEELVMMLGYRNGDTFLTDEFQKYGKLYLAAEDGSVGTRGNVMDVYRENPVDRCRCCGPSSGWFRKRIRGNSRGKKPTCRWKKEWLAEWAPVLAASQRRRSRMRIPGSRMQGSVRTGRFLRRRRWRYEYGSENCGSFL